MYTCMYIRICIHTHFKNKFEAFIRICIHTHLKNKFEAFLVRIFNRFSQPRRKAFHFFFVRVPFVYLHPIF